VLNVNSESESTLEIEENQRKIQAYRKDAVRGAALLCCPCTSIFCALSALVACGTGDKRFYCDRQDSREIGYCKWTTCENDYCCDVCSWHGALPAETTWDVAKYAFCVFSAKNEPLKRYSTGPERQQMTRINQSRSHIIDHSIQRLPKVLTEIISEYEEETQPTDTRLASSREVPRPMLVARDHLDILILDDRS